MDPKQLRLAMRSTVGKATAQGRTIVRDEAKKVLNVKAGTVNDAVTSFTKEIGGSPQGTIRVSKKPLTLFDFKGTRVTKKGGASFQTRKDKARINLRHGFLVILKSGHRGVFVRGKHLPTKGPNVGGVRHWKDKRTGKMRKARIKLTPGGIAGSFVIEEGKGPSVLTVVNKPDLTKRVVDKIASKLTEIFLGQYSRFGLSRPV